MCDMTPEQILARLKELNTRWNKAEELNAKGALKNTPKIVSELQNISVEFDQLYSELFRIKPEWICEIQYLGYTGHAPFVPLSSTS